MADTMTAGVNGTAPHTASETDRVMVEALEGAKAKGKSIKPKVRASKADRLDSLWRKFSDQTFSLKGEIAGQKVSMKTEGFPESLDAEDVVEHFRENAGTATRSKAVGAAKAGGKAEIGSGDDAADLAEILIEQ